MQERVAWPEDSDGRPELASNMPPDLAAKVKGYEPSWLREGASYEKYVEEVGWPRLHGNPALRAGRREYKTFASLGVERGIFRLGLRCSERIDISLLPRRAARCA